MTWSAILFLGLCLPGAGAAQEKHLSFQRMELLLQWFEAEPLDLPACAAGLEEGWEGAWRFVRSAIRYVPYAGIVKGPDGVLCSGEGNSLEKALLLARLLQEKGYTVRLCSASFPEGKGVPPAFPADGSPGKAGEGVGPGRGVPASLAEAARLLGYPEGVLEAYAQEHRYAVEARCALLRQRTLARVRTLEPVLPRVTPPRAAERACWWVQAAVSEEQWLDLDPTFAAKPGEAPVAEAEETFDPDELPEESTGTFEAVLYLEQGNGRTELLRFRDTLPRLCLSPVSMAFIPSAPSLFPDPRKNWEAYQKQERFVCAANAGGRVLLGRAFDLQGRVFEGGGDSRIEAAKGMGQGLTGLFGGAGGVKAAGAWTLLLEGKVTTPAGESSFTRHLVKGGTDPAATRIALLSSFSYVIVPGPVKGAFFTRACLRSLAEKKGILEHLPVGDPKKLLAEVPQYPAELFAFVRALRPLCDEYLPGASFPFLLVGYERRFSGLPSKQVYIDTGYDIVTCPLAVTRPAPGLGLRFGAALTELERILVEEGSGEPVISPAGLFLQARAAGVSIRAVKKAEELPELPAEARALLVEALDRGRIVVVPEAPLSRRGRPWVPAYVFDPESGLCIGRIGRRGQAMTEYLEKIDFIMSLVGAIDSFSKMMQCMTAAIIAPLAGKSQAEARRDFARCATEWAMGRLFAGAKVPFNISPTPVNMAADAVVGGIPGTPFGGFTGMISKGTAEGLFGK